MTIKSVLNLFFAPEGGGSSNTNTDSLDSLDSLNDVDLLSQETNTDDNDDTDKGSEGEEDTEEEDTESTPKDKKKKVEEGEEEEEDVEKDEAKEEEEDEEEEEDKPVLVDGRITVKGLKEQYPDIFKKNPALKDVIFREREYSKRFGSIEDADEASAKSELFDNFENTLLSGGIGELLDAVADTDQSAALKIAENFLPELYARSKPVFAKVTLPIVKGMLRNTFTRAQNQGNKQLALACQYISRDLFESSDVIRATEMEDSTPDPRLNEINRQRQEFHDSQINNARNDVLESVTSKLAKDIAARIPGSVSEFTRDALISKITDELDSTLFKDKAHMAHLSSLWKKMSKAGFSSEAKARIISASLGRARQVLPAVIAKVKSQSKNGNTTTKKVVADGTKDRKFPNQTGSKSRGSSPVKLDRNMSDFEFLSK